MKSVSNRYPTEADFIGLYKGTAARGAPRVGGKRTKSAKRGFHPMTGMRFALCFHRRGFARTHEGSGS